MSKTVGGVEHKYVLSGSQIIAEYYGTTTNIYLYDDSGSPIGLATRQSSDTEGVYQYYYFEKNLQGDILGIYTSSGQKVVWYMYDAYGNITTAIASGYGTLRDSNPFRYRGYYYDTETGFYYLNSRYYDPVTGRFISMDDVSVVTASPTALTDKNLFAYCDNNPVMRTDNGGEFWHMIVGAAIGAVINGVTKIASNIAEGNNWADGLGTSLASGAASGFLASTGLGIAGVAIGNGVIAMADNAINQVVENGGFDDFDVGDMLIDGVVGGLAGLVGGAGKGTKHLMNLGKQTVKRTVNETLHKGLRQGMKEAGKAFVYYGKSSLKHYKAVIRGLGKDIAITAASVAATSTGMKKLYWNLLER